MVADYVMALENATPSSNPVERDRTIFTIFREGVYLLRNPERFHNPVINIGALVLTTLVTQKHLHFAVFPQMAENGLGFAPFPSPQDPTTFSGGIAFPENYIELAKADPVASLTSLVCVGEAARNFHALQAVNPQLSIDMIEEGWEKDEPRLDAITAEAAHTLSFVGCIEELDISFSPSVTAAMERNPRGFADLSAQATRLGLGGQPMPMLSAPQLADIAQLEYLAITKPLDAVRTFAHRLEEGSPLWQTPAAIEEALRGIDSTLHLHCNPLPEPFDTAILLQPKIIQVGSVNQEEDGCYGSPPAYAENFAKLQALRPN